jgi:hypothetical protein
MNKLAFFVEGQGDLIFIKNLIIYMAGLNHVSITSIEESGGEQVIILEIHARSANEEYFILVKNCCRDGAVLSSIRKDYCRMVEEGFKKIIGLRDAHPVYNKSQLPDFRHHLIKTLLPAGACQVIFLFCIMELEAWLIAEYNHFPKMHSAISVARIHQELAIDVVNDDLSELNNPAEDLKNIYRLEGITYRKDKEIMKNIVSTLDQAFLRSNVSSKFEDLQTLYHELDLFFSFL